MDFKKIIIGFIPVFAIALLVCMGVTSLWNLAFHGVAIIDWETSFRFSILLAILVPMIDFRKRMKFRK